jgi:hypothetical protein
VCPTPDALYLEASPPAAIQTNKIKSCRYALCRGSTSRIPPPANHGTPGTMHVTPANNYEVHLAGICDEGFTTVFKKKRNNNLVIYIKAGQLWSVGVRTSSSIPVTSKKLELKSIITSRIFSHVSASDSENFMC